MALAAVWLEHRCLHDLSLWRIFESEENILLHAESFSRRAKRHRGGDVLIKGRR